MFRISNLQYNIDSIKSKKYIETFDNVNLTYFITEHTEKRTQNVLDIM